MRQLTRDRHAKTSERPAPPGPPAAAEGLLEAVEGDMDLLKELAALFLDNAKRLLERMRAADTAGDLPRVAREAHAMRGSVGNFRVASATTATEQLEATARAGDADGARDALAVVETEIRALMDLLTPLVGR